MLRMLLIFCLVLSSHNVLGNENVLTNENVTSNEIAFGEEDSPVTIIEYGSLTCDHCIGFHRKILSKLEEKYVKAGKVRFIYRHYPTSKVALQAAVAVECASENHYQVLKDFYFNIKEWYSPRTRDEAFKKLARVATNDISRYENCLKSENVKARIISGQKAALQQYGVHGTPTFIINEKVFKGEHQFQALEEIIQKDLAID